MVLLSTNEFYGFTIKAP